MRVAILLLPVLFLTNAFAWEDTPVDKYSSFKVESKTKKSPTWSKLPARVILQGEELSFKIAPITGGEVRWYQIIPNTNSYYKNANHPWEKDAYKWAGFGKIKYTVRELEGFRGKWEIEPLSELSGHKARNYHSNLGSFWFQAKVKKGDRILRSSGIEDNDSRNITPAVFRLTIQSGTDYLGCLTGFFNVPGVFGSIPYQCTNYIGVDCADVLVAARTKWKKQSTMKDYNVDMLVKSWPKVTTVKIDEGKPDKPLEWKKDIQAGDLIAVKYAGRTRYQHIGSLYRDGDEDGKLSPEDLVLHAGPEALNLTRLKFGGFDGDVVILRPK